MKQTETMTGTEKVEGDRKCERRQRRLASDYWSMVKIPRHHCHTIGNTTVRPTTWIGAYHSIVCASMHAAAAVVCRSVYNRLPSKVRRLFAVIIQ